MDRLLCRIREALLEGPHPPLPAPPVAPSPVSPPAPPDEPPASLLPMFRAAFERAGGRYLTAADEVGARLLVATGYPGVEVGIDRADLLIADTGTILRHYPDAAGSRVSLLPEVSVFLAAPRDLVPDLPAALRAAEPRHRAGRAYTVLITGPSRTADIEKTLVIPAHGPRELVLVMLPG